jgi:hypothetical protein
MVWLQANMAAELPSRFVAKAPEQPDEIVTDHEAISSRNDLVFNRVQTDHWGRCPVVKMTVDGLSHISLQILEGVRLREDRVTESAGFVSAFGRLLNREDDLTIRHGSDYNACWASRALTQPYFWGGSVLSSARLRAASTCACIFGYTARIVSAVTAGIS